MGTIVGLEYRLGWFLVLGIVTISLVAWFGDDSPVARWLGLIVPIAVAIISLWPF